jgi:hypothetical protein
MEKECEGCFCMRIILNDREKNNPGKVSCENDKLDCPCKICLVKMMCDITEHGMVCEQWIDFNTKYSSSEYWVERRENANKVQSCKKKNSC